MAPKTIAKWTACGLLILVVSAAIVALATNHRGQPKGASNSMIGGAFTTEFEGRQVTLQIPKMELKTQEDKDRLQGILMEQIKSNPQVNAAHEARFKEWKEKNRQSLFADLDAAEKSELEKIDQMSVEAEQKELLKKQVGESANAARRQIEERIATTKMPPIQ